MLNFTKIMGTVVVALVATTQIAMAKNVLHTKQTHLFPNFAADGTSNLKYYGGPVISSAKIYVVYWGAGVDSTVKSDIGAFYKTFVTSNHMDWLSEYNTNLTGVNGHAGTQQTIGRGSYGGEYVIKPANTSTNLMDSDIQTELAAQLSAHKLPKADKNSLYMIHFPPGITINIDAQNASCSSFCAYHEGFVAPKLGNIYYGVMPDLGSGACSFGCGFGGSVFDSTTIVASHEVTEAITDPFPTPGSNPAYPQAWNTVDGSEIGDLCSSTTATVSTSQRTYSIQGEYDNSTSSCKSGSYQAD